MTQINQYTNEVTTLSNEDFFDIDEFLGPGYQSAKLTWANLLTNIEDQITWENIYSVDGQLDALRTVDTDGFNIGFTGTGSFGVGVAPTSIIQKFEVDGTARVTQLMSGVTSFLQANVQHELGGFTRIAEGLHIGDNTLAYTNSQPLAIDIPGSSAYVVFTDQGADNVGLNVFDQTFGPTVTKDLQISCRSLSLPTSNAVKLSLNTAPSNRTEAFNLDGNIRLDTTLLNANLGAATRAVRININGTDYRMNLWSI